MEKIPETKPRFDIGKNKEVKTRIDLIQETVREMQKERPEIVSFAMFGSMVKGYATPESDIDGKMIVSVDSPKSIWEPSFRVEIFWNSSQAGDSKTQNEILLPPCQISARFDKKN